MKFLIFLILIIYPLNCFGQELIWSEKIGGSGDDRIFKTINDNQENIFLIGYFKGTIFPGLTASGSTYDIFIAKYNKAGALIWIKQIGSNLDDFADAISLTPDGSKLLVAGGFFGDKCIFGPGMELPNSESGTSDCFVVSMNVSDGSFNNISRIAYGNGHQRPQAMKFDPNGNLVIIGYIHGDSNLTYFNSVETISCEGLQNYFLLQLNSNFQFNWVKKFTGTDVLNKLFSLDVDNTGYYISGTNKKNLNLGFANLYSQDDTPDMFLFKTDFNGTGQWIRSIRGNNTDVNVYTTCDNQGYVYISGYYASSDLSVDSTATLKSLRSPIPNRGGNDLFYAKYKTDGTLQWFDYAGSKGDDRVTRLSTNGDYVVIAGQFGGEMTLNNKVLKPAGTLDINGIGKADALGIVHDKDDNLLYTITAGGDQEDVAQSCVIDNEGNYIFTGNYFSSPIIFDESHSLVNSKTTTPLTRDVFIAKYKARSITLVPTSIKCSGGTASITANPKGAWAGTKKYLWSKVGNTGFSETTPTISNVMAGTYNCTITDDLLNTETASIEIKDPSPLSINIKTKTDVTCFGSANGYIEPEVTGGTGEKYYQWTGTGNGLNAKSLVQSSLTKGIYNLTVTDENGCVDSENNIEIIQPGKIIFKGTEPSPINGSDMGSVNLVVQGGVSDYGYLWSGPSSYSANVGNISGLTVAGSYTITVTDQNLCKADTTVLVVNSNSLYGSISQKKVVSCFGGSDGSITVTGYTTNPTPSFTYAWTGPGTFTASTATIDNIPAGTYSVIITDSHPEPDQTYVISNIVITQPASGLTVTASSTDETCFGKSNGMVDANPVGGTFPYFFQWEKDGIVIPNTTEVISSIGAGSYKVIVTDALGCTNNTTNVVNSPTSALSVNAVTTPVTCRGSKNDGTISLNVSGATGAVTYKWSNGFEGPNLISLPEGTYSCTITDNNKCSVSITQTVDQPPQLSAQFTVSNVSCNGASNGAINLTPVGGNAGTYTYLWSNNATSEDISGLSAGTYIVKITDFKKCEGTFTSTISEPEDLNVTSSLIQNANCNGVPNGSISLNTTGGTLPYNWVWSNTQTGPVATNLSAGSYSVTVTDANSCSETANFNITEPTALTISEIPSSHNDLICNGVSSGVLEVSASGSSGTFQYSIDGTNWQSSGVFSNLVADDYLVMARDQNVTSCTTTSPAITIHQPAELTLTTTKADITCFGLNNGTINAQGTGGTGALAYSLLLNDAPTGNITGASSGIFNDLTAGTTYKVRVTDANNCGPVESSIQTISEPQVVALNVTKADITCFGLNNGTINAQGTGGTGTLAYSLLLNDAPNSNITGASSGIFTGLTAGTTYKVRVTDANNCGPVESSIQTITEPQAVALNVTKADITCFGLNNGTINAQGTGGTGGLAYSLLLNDVPTGNITGASSGIFTDLTAGTTYKVRVTDANNCAPVESSIQIISEPQAVALNVTKADITCFGLNNGTINAQGTGGTGALAYSLLLNDAPTGNITGASSGIFTDLTAGTTYKVRVTDANNCGPVESSIQTISEPQVVALNVTKADITCFGLNNGTINAQGTGGTGTLAYSLLLNDATTGNITGASSGIFTDLTAGSNYKVRVTDANNCGPVESSIQTITEPQVVALNVTKADITCFGLNNGTINAQGTGGTGTLAYSLLLNDAPNGNITGASSGIFTGLTAGTTYEVRVTDANNCGPVESSIQTITEPQVVALNVTKADITCFGLNNGTINAQGTGGTGTLAYSLLLNDAITGNITGASSGIFTDLTAGSNYKVRVTDANNCGPVESSIQTITEPQVVALNVTKVDITCFGLNNGTINAQGTGGTGTLAFSLLLNDAPNGNITGASSGIFTGLTAGTTYKVRVTDANNCAPVESSIQTISEPQAVALNVTKADITCFGLNNGTINAQGTGGTGALAYSLLLNDAPTGNITGASSGIFTDLTAGTTYKIRVTDANNCGPIISGEYSIAEPAAINILSAVTTDINCFGLTTGAINVQANGGIGALTYSLLQNNIASGNSSGTTTGMFTDLAAGAGYKVQVTDANNCSPVASSDITITQPAAIVINNLAITDISCNGETSGSITVEAVGGLGALSYKLLLNNTPTLNLSGESTGIFTDVVAGTSYRVEVTDSNNCGPISSSELAITEPASAIEINSISVTDNTCKDVSDGSIKIIASGGTGALTYKLYINNNLFGNSRSGTFTNLPASNLYTVKVTDENNCSNSSTQMITVAEPLNDVGILNVSYTDVSCKGLNNGTITVQAQGGAGLSYKLLKDDVVISNPSGATSGIFTELAPGNSYKVLVNDANNCGPLLSENIRIVDAQPIIPGSLTVSDISCFGLQNGRVSLQVTGGKRPLTYKLLLNNVPTNNTSGTSSGSFSNVQAGTGYTIEVNDFNNCGPVLSSVVNVKEPSMILITAESVSRTSGSGQSNGSVGVLAKGGTGTLTYTLNTGIQQTNGIFSSLPRGTYSISVTDANNCGPVTSNFLIIDDPTSVELIKAGSVRLYPNPATEKVFVEVKNAEFKDLKVELKNMTGQAAVTQKFENVTPGFIAAIDLYQLPKGIYVIVVNNQVLKEKLVIQ